jgi:sporadic carbohydrate cluster 2OG-Fe(II) oxygenase
LTEVSIVIVVANPTEVTTRVDADRSERFLCDGFIIAPTENFDVLSNIIEDLGKWTSRWLSSDGEARSIGALSRSHETVSARHINELRLHLFAHLNSQPDTRAKYFALASDLLFDIVGNELAMQTKVNLSIQQPDDPGSVLEIHSDVWTGDSPFQVVLWVPLTDTTGTNAMFFLPPEPSYEAYRRVRAGQLRSMTEVRAAYDSQISTIEMKVGQVLVFNSNCLHGNQLNTTTMTRWSLNCRFVNLLAPATNPERRLGSYYTPLTVRPATRMGLRAIELMSLEAPTTEP